jgi:hypothetical protein
MTQNVLKSKEISAMPDRMVAHRSSNNHPRSSAIGITKNIE